MGNYYKKKRGQFDINNVSIKIESTGKAISTGQIVCTLELSKNTVCGDNYKKVIEKLNDFYNNDFSDKDKSLVIIYNNYIVAKEVTKTLKDKELLKLLYNLLIDYPEIFYVSAPQLRTVFVMAYLTISKVAREEFEKNFTMDILSIMDKHNINFDIEGAFNDIYNIMSSINTM